MPDSLGQKVFHLIPSLPFSPSSALREINYEFRFLFPFRLKISIVGAVRLTQVKPYNNLMSTYAYEYCMHASLHTFGR
jgi:hypothetical protein